MPSFCKKCNADMFICQICGKDACSAENDVKRVNNKNACLSCYTKDCLSCYTNSEEKVIIEEQVDKVLKTFNSINNPKK